MKMNDRPVFGLALLCVCLLAPVIAHADVITFTNATPITIPSSGVADPYPVAIDVSGVSGSVTSFTLTLSNITHTFVDDISAAIVSPSGTAVLLFSGAGPNFLERGAKDIANQTWVFDEIATETLPRGTPPVSGTYKPGLFEYDDTFPARLPDLRSYGSPLNPQLDVLTYGFSFVPYLAEDLNGQWRLLVMDSNAGDSGTIAGGWSISIGFTPTAVPEPSTAILLTIIGSAGGASRLWRRRRGH